MFNVYTQMNHVQPASSNCQTSVSQTVSNGMFSTSQGIFPNSLGNPSASAPPSANRGDRFSLPYSGNGTTPPYAPPAYSAVSKQYKTDVRKLFCIVQH